MKTYSKKAKTDFFIFKILNISSIRIFQSQWIQRFFGAASDSIGDAVCFSDQNFGWQIPLPIVCFRKILFDILETVEKFRETAEI